MVSFLFLFYISPLSQLKSHYRQFPCGSFGSQTSNSILLEEIGRTARDKQIAAPSRRPYTGTAEEDGSEWRRKKDWWFWEPGEPIRVWTGSQGQSIRGGGLTLGTDVSAVWEWKTLHVGRWGHLPDGGPLVSPSLGSHSPWKKECENWERAQRTATKIMNWL